jgi:transposase
MSSDLVSQNQDERQSPHAAEELLRPAVLWRKISFGNHSEAGCRFAERILTTVQTLRLQKRHVPAYLSEALIAHRTGLLAPALVPVGV